LQATPACLERKRDSVEGVGRNVSEAERETERERGKASERMEGRGGEGLKGGRNHVR